MEEDPSTGYTWSVYINGDSESILQIVRNYEPAATKLTEGATGTVTYEIKSGHIDENVVNRVRFVQARQGHVADEVNVTMVIYNVPFL